MKGFKIKFLRVFQSSHPLIDGAEHQGDAHCVLMIISQNIAPDGKRGGKQPGRGVKAIVAKREERADARHVGGGGKFRLARAGKIFRASRRLQRFSEQGAR